MATKKPNERNTKAEILEAFNELVKEKAALKSQVDQLSKEKQPVVKEIQTVETKLTMNQTQSVQQKMNYIIESLAKIKLGFGSAVSDLSEKLTTEASQLQEIRSGVATETEQLQSLHNLQVADDILNTLIKTYEDNSKAFEEEFSQKREALEQETSKQYKTWEQEQEEHKLAIKERNGTINKTRQREVTEYQYNLELERKLNTEEYEQNQKRLYNELEEFRQEQEKLWAEREKAIALVEKQFEEYKSKVEAFPKEKETAIKKATEEGKGIAYYQAKIKADLAAKEVEGQKRFYEQRLQSLEQTIQNQEIRIQSLAKQLDSALKQVQDLAVKAIEGASNVNSYQAVREIAIEQAKNQLKNK